MEKKESQNLGLGELSTIRDILMGQQMAEYEKRFASLTQDLSASNGHLNARLDELRENSWAKVESLEAELKARLDQLERLMSEKLDQLNTKVSQTSTSDKAAIGKMLAEIGQKLMGEK